MTDIPLPDRVKAILAERLGMDPARLSDDARLMEELGMDSLDAVQFVLAVETEFDIELPDEEVTQVSTVAELIGLVDGAVARRGSPS